MKKPASDSSPRLASPPARRTFVSGWDEIVYLYHRIVHWFYGQGSPARARPFAKRLERLLRREAADHQAIMGEECWSLVYELKGNLRKAIEYRLSEIRLMKWLLAAKAREEKSGSVERHYWPVDHPALADRLAILAILYNQSGDAKHARASIKAAKRLAEVHGFDFASPALFDDLVGPAKGGAAARPPTKRR